MHWYTWLFPKIVLDTSSRYNTRIRILEEKGKYKLLVNGSRESGEYIKELWLYAMEKLGVTKDIPVKNILVLGVAGGTVIHLLRDAYPGARITGVEIDRVMIGIGKRYFGLDGVSGLTIVEADAQAYVKKTKEKYDMVVVDVFIGPDIPEFVGSGAFLETVRSLLSQRGMVFINYLREREYGEKAEKLEHALRKYFSSVGLVNRQYNRFFLARFPGEKKPES